MPVSGSQSELSSKLFTDGGGAHLTTGGRCDRRHLGRIREPAQDDEAEAGWQAAQNRAKSRKAYVVMFNCQETPNSSSTHANFLLNGYLSSGMRILPSLDNTSKYFASASSLEFST